MSNHDWANATQNRLVNVVEIFHWKQLAHAQRSLQESEMLSVSTYVLLWRHLDVYYPYVDRMFLLSGLQSVVHNGLASLVRRDC